MKKNRYSRKMLSLSLVLVMLLSLVIQSETVFADAQERPNVRISSFKVTAQDGTVPNDGLTINKLAKITLRWDAFSYTDTLEEGDYFNITLPKEFKFPDDPATCNFDIFAPNKVDVVARAVVTPDNSEGGGNIKVTFTDYVKNKDKIRGVIYLNANFNKDLITESGTPEIVVSIGSSAFEIPVKVKKPEYPELNNETLQKWSGHDLTPEGNVKWSLRINHKKDNYTRIKIVDELLQYTAGITYVKGSFELSKTVMDEYGNETNIISTENISDKVVISEDGKSFTYPMDDITDGQQYMLRYQTTYKKGYKIRNNAQFRANGITVSLNSSYMVSEAGGLGIGNAVSKIKIVKSDAEKNEIKLQNAKFKITDVDNPANPIILTTNSSGEALSKKLDPGDYKIQEIEAPAGYKLDETIYDARVSEDDEFVKEITNAPITKDVTVRKEWVGATGGAVTAILKADGVEINRHELTSADAWTYTFRNLRQYKPGTLEEIKYTVEEEKVPAGYTATYENDPTGVLVIKNNQNPETPSEPSDSTPLRRGTPSEPPTTPSTTPSNPPETPNEPTVPGVNIDDKDVPKVDKVDEVKVPTEAKPVEDNTAKIELPNESVPKSYVPKVADDKPKLPQTGQNFMLIELLAAIGLFAVSAGIIISRRLRKHN